MADSGFAAHQVMTSKYHEEMEDAAGHSTTTKAGHLGASRLSQGIMAAAPLPDRPRWGGTSAGGGRKVFMAAEHAYGATAGCGIVVRHFVSSRARSGGPSGGKMTWRCFIDRVVS